MKKVSLFLLTLLISLTCLTGCSENTLDKEALEPFIGEWDCREATLEETGDEGCLYVGYLQMYVTEDGYFSMYDAEAGNPGISGYLYPSADGTASLECDGEDFDPPFCWIGMGKKTDLTYTMTEEDGQMRLDLTYTNKSEETATLVFDRIE